MTMMTINLQCKRTFIASRPLCLKKTFEFENCKDEAQDTAVSGAAVKLYANLVSTTSWVRVPYRYRFLKEICPLLGLANFSKCNRLIITGSTVNSASGSRCAAQLQRHMSVDP